MTTFVNIWLKEIRLYGNYYHIVNDIGKKNEEYQNTQEVLNIIKNKLENIVLPLIKPLNDIVKSYLTILDMIQDDGINIPEYKLFSNINAVTVFDCFRVMYYLNNDFYKPAIILFPNKVKEDLYELELNHVFVKYKVVDLISPNHIVMNTYNNNMLISSLKSDFKDQIILVSNFYDKIVIKFWTKSSDIVLILECIQK